MSKRNKKTFPSLGAILLAAVMATAFAPRSVMAVNAIGNAIQSAFIEGNGKIQKIVNVQEAPVLMAMAHTLDNKEKSSTEDKTKTQMRVAVLANQLGFNDNAVVELLTILEKNGIPEENVRSKLVDVATHFAQTSDMLSALELSDPHASELARKANQAFDSGGLAQADDLLDQARKAELAGVQQPSAVRPTVRKAEDRPALNAAELTAVRGDIALIQLRYADAAQRFKEAGNAVPAGHPDEAVRYLNSEADALYREGDERGDNTALLQSIDMWRLVLQQRPREQVPLDWAATQTNLGIALEKLGERDGDPGHLKEAVALFRAALEVRTRERVPFDWAATETDLGAALTTLGWRENGTARLQEAAAAFRAALEVRTRERVPLDWAAAQHQLGCALLDLGARESGTAQLAEAVAAFQAALEKRARDVVPPDWAATQEKLGEALTELGERESGTSRLEAALASFHTALEWRTRERVPLDWAATQLHLGEALEALGEREGGTDQLQAAISSFHAALEEYTREKVPLHWAWTQQNLGKALTVLGERESGIDHLKQAVDAETAALPMFVSLGDTDDVGKCRAQIEQATALLKQRQPR